MSRQGLALLVLAGLVVPAATVAQTLPPAQQITSSTDGISERWNNRTSTSSGRKILFAGSNDTIYLYNGSTVQSVQTTTGEAIREAVMMLGTGGSAGSVIGGWRRGDGSGWVSTDAGAPHQITLNPEHLSIRSGCVFMTLQTAANGNQAFQIDPATGNRTQISTDTSTANHGAFRIFSDGCTKVAWSWKNASNLDDIQYWNGSTVTTVATNILDMTFSFSGGKIVYAKTVSGIQQVFVIDTNTSLTPVQLSSETDATKVLTRPQTDGRHVAWYRSNADGSSAQLVLNGGVVFPTGTLGKLDNAEFPFQLNRGQLLWANGAPVSPRTIYYDDGTRTLPVNPSPATNILLPWLTDGNIVFLGPTPTGGADNDVFRVTGTAPTDASQPAAPLTVQATPGTGQVTVDWDRVLGATSYNLYRANVPGVTRDNYASLAGGTRITAVTPPYTLTVPTNSSYYFAVTAVDGSGEGPSSRNASATVVGNLTWQSVGGLSATSFFSIAADASNSSLAYAGANGSIHRSTDGGINWAPALSSATTGASRIVALAVAGSQVWANAMTQADIWLSANNGVAWAKNLDAGGFGESNGSLAIDPTDSATVYAGDFILPGKTSAHSLVIKLVNGSWTLTPEGPGFDEIHAYAIAIDPNNHLTLYAGGSGTPNVAKSINGAASWTDVPISGNTGGVYSIVVDPTNSNIVYATTRDLGVYKSVNGGATWTAKNAGLTGVATSSGTGFNSLLIDPQNSSYLHLGAGNGYWYSTNGGESWTAANSGFGGSPAYIYALALTPARRLLAATATGLYMLSVGPAPVVTGVSPNSDNIAGGTVVTITGTGFQPAATVTFGGAPATNVTVVNATTITATTPAHAAGVVNVVVTNFDGQSGTLGDGFTYTNVPPSPPANVSAKAQTATSVLITWSASATATSYQIFRRDPGGSVAPVGTSNTLQFTDSTAGATTSYLYSVRAVNAAGASADSAQDVATTVIFMDDPLASGVTVKATHLTQIRSATNALRQLAGLTAATFTDPAPSGIAIKAIHIVEVRTALDQALGLLGYATGGYTDGALNGVRVKTIHFQQIRDRVQ